MIEWIKQHPYLSGGLVLLVIVLFLVLRGRGGSSQAVQTGPSDALQAAGLQAQTQQAAIQAGATAHSQDLQAQLAAVSVQAQTAQNAIDATKAVELAKIGAQLNASDTAAEVQSHIADVSAGSAVQIATVNAGAAVAQTQAQTAAAVQIAGIQVGGQVQIAGIQGQVAIAQSNNQLAAQIDTNATAKDISLINATRDVTLGAQGVQINAQNNATIVDVATLQADVAALGITTQGDVATHYIDVQGQIDQNRLNLTKGQFDDLLMYLGSPAGNRGGEAANINAALVTGFFGQSAAPVVAANASENNAGSPGAWLTGIGNLATGIGNGLVGVAKVAAAA